MKLDPQAFPPFGWKMEQLVVISWDQHLAVFVNRDTFIH